MLLLLFKVGEGRYALASDQIAEVVPNVKAKKIPLAPDYVAGLINCRGAAIPVIDLGTLLTGAPCPARYSTRIILVHYPLENRGIMPLGLIATAVTETIKTRYLEIPKSGVLMDEALYTGDMAADSEKMVQWFDLRQLLPASEIAKLF